MKPAVSLAVFAVTLSLCIIAGESGGPAGGKEIFERRCSGCHALDIDKEGPRLRGIYGRSSGGTPSFLYSQGLKSAHILWDAGSLDRWLADPEKLVPDNDMAFRLASPDERKRIIAYLKHLSAAPGAL